MHWHSRACTLECTGTLELVPLGCVGTYRLVVAELNHCGVKLRDATGASNSVVEIAPGICTGSVTAPKGRHLYGFGDRPQVSYSGITASRIGESVRRIGWPSLASCEHFVPHPLQTKTYFSQEKELR